MTSFKKVTILGRSEIALNELNANLNAILNRGISFNDNVDCRVILFTSSSTPNAENTIAHSLGKTPQGFIVVSIDSPANVYNGATSWTTENIFLKVSVASAVVKIIVF